MSDATEIGNRLSALLRYLSHESLGPARCETVERAVGATIEEVVAWVAPDGEIDVYAVREMLVQLDDAGVAFERPAGGAFRGPGRREGPAPVPTTTVSNTTAPLTTLGACLERYLDGR